MVSMREPIPSKEGNFFTADCVFPSLEGCRGGFRAPPRAQLPKAVLNELPPLPERCVFSFSISPRRDEWGESRREGQREKRATSPRPSPPFGEEREKKNLVLTSFKTPIDVRTFEGNPVAAYPFTPRRGMDCVCSFGSSPPRRGQGWVHSILVILCMFYPLPHQAQLTDAVDQHGYRFTELNIPKSNKIGFTHVDPDTTGIRFVNSLSDDRSLANRVLLSGSGVALGDVNGDGWCDLYFCGLDHDNALYRNLGNWEFEEITSMAGLACSGQDSTGASFADTDGDGDVDLLVNSFGSGTRVFQNDGNGRFSEITKRARVASKSGSTSLALADIDGDSDLDLYVANFRPNTIQDRVATRFRIRMVNNRPVVALVDNRSTTLPDLKNRFIVTPSGTVLELGEPDVLYLNDGSGRFSSVSFTDGSFLDENGRPLPVPPRDWGLAVQFHDFTGDGAPDIYVCNDLYTPDRIWVNDGTGRFRALDNRSLRNTSTFSMGVDFADLERDGDVDFFVVDMLSRSHLDRQIQVSQSRPRVSPVGLIRNRLQISRNTLQVNRGDNTFAETAYFCGLEASEWSWGPIFIDVDLDGWEDVLVTNGQLRDFQNADMADQLETAKAARQLSQSDMTELIANYPDLRTSNLAFRNRGDLTFEEVGAAWGFDTDGISQGMALGDLDNDGDMDVVMNNLNGVAGVYRNESGAARVAVRLKGAGGNRQGIGAKIRVKGGPVEQSQEMISGGRYLSGDQAMRVFAAGNPEAHLTIEVKWRSGKESVVEEAKANRIYEIEESEAMASNPKSNSKSKIQNPKSEGSFFEDVSELLGHRHVEEVFDDFGRQPLLPRRMSQLGPGVSWHDYDGDGWEDLIVGSGRGGRLGVYRNDGKGGFEKVEGGVVNRPVTRDQTTVLGMGSRIVVGSSNYEDGLAVGGWVRLYELEAGKVEDGMAGDQSSAGPLAMGDVDGDGDLDMFVGGRTVAGRYGGSGKSKMMRNERGRYEVMQEWDRPGMVSGAVLSDLDGDGYSELILACEWGPVRVFENKGGKFKEVTEEWGMSEYRGWWNGVTTGDMDGDGRMDIIATNWGLNSRYRASREHPMKVYYGDFDGNGIEEVVEARWDEELGKEVPVRGLKAVRAAVPYVGERIKSYRAYGEGSVEEIFGEALKKAGKLEANTLESMVFMNRGGKFEGKTLPQEAQWSPGYGVSVGDYNGDGKEDVFVSQNFYAVNPEEWRSDAGRGMWLKGDGKGGMEVVDGAESGVKVYGEQRGSALGDYDGDGRIDLVVSQNGAQTKLYRNVRGKPGLRVRLKGPAGNPKGVGAQIRIERGREKGPVREVKAGSGYWSQESAVQVMSVEEGSKVWVRWPGGKETQSEIPKGAREIEVDMNGKVRVRG